MVFAHPVNLSGVQGLRRTAFFQKDYTEVFSAVADDLTLDFAGLCPVGAEVFADAVGDIDALADVTIACDVVPDHVDSGFVFQIQHGIVLSIGGFHR
jgi:hypothetical protein